MQNDYTIVYPLYNLLMLVTFHQLKKENSKEMTKIICILSLGISGNPITLNNDNRVVLNKPHKIV